MAKEIDVAKLDEALGTFGSLQAAIQHMEQEKLTLEKDKSLLKHDNKELMETNVKLDSQKKYLEEKVKGYQNQSRSLCSIK